MTTLLVGLVATLALNGLTMALLERAFHSQSLAPHHFRDPIKVRATDAAKRRLYAINSTISLVVLFTCAVPLYSHFFTTSNLSPFRVLFESLFILLAYDVLYYALHRFAFHHRKLMKYVHALHHSARTPSANESLYTHPVELTLGLCLFMLCTFALGPVHIYSFLVANLVYTELNIIIHSGIAFPSGPMRIFNLWARKHHGHHGVDMTKNYGSVSPLWDTLFGTSI